ncbi:hypothetical protein ES703_29138 [subsurface metagenome]
MEKKGWIKIWRRLQNSKIWSSKPFTKGQAWVDLLLRASHDDYTFDFKAAKIKMKSGLIKNMKIKIKSGQIFIFKKSLAKDWGWSRQKVANFLNGLAGNNGKIREIDVSHFKKKRHHRIKIRTPSGTPYGLLITIINWELYQSKKKEETPSVTPNPKRTRIETDTNKNVYYNKKVILIYSGLLNFWNSKNIVIHTSLSPKTEKNIQDRIKRILKFTTIKEVKQRISNYAILLKGEEYDLCTYTWTFQEFLTRFENGRTDKFADLEKAKLNLRKNRGGYNGKNKQDNQRPKSKKPGKDKYKHLEETY